MVSWGEAAISCHTVCLAAVGWEAPRKLSVPGTSFLARKDTGPQEAAAPPATLSSGVPQGSRRLKWVPEIESRQELYLVK